MKHLLTVLALLFSVARADVVLTQNTISWTIAGSPTYGQFFNGDYWVVGPVTITAISPASVLDVTQGNWIMHGSMVNPTASPTHQQGFDNKPGSTGASYSASLNAARPGGNDLSVGNPLVLVAGQSLVSTRSKTTPNIRPCLLDAAVLTVVSEALVGDYLRPPYSGTDKKLIPVASLDESIMQSDPDVADSPLLADAEYWLQKVKIEINTDVGGRNIHPANNQPDYGREIAGNYQKSFQLLHLSKYTVAQRRYLFRLAVQLGLDIYGAAKAGGDWYTNGGHNQGRKMPLVFASFATNDADLIEYSDAAQHFIFAEDQSTFYVTQAAVDRTTNGTLYTPTAATGSGQNITLTFTSHSIPLGSGTESAIVRLEGFTPTDWNGHWIVNARSSTQITVWEFNSTGAKTVTSGAASVIGTVTHLPNWRPDNRTRVAPYLSEHIGIPEWGIEHTQEPDNDNYKWEAIYRTIHGCNLPGHFMTIRRIPGGVERWNWSPAWDYMDRYMVIEGPSSSNITNKVPTFTNNFWNAYRYASVVTGAPTIAVTTPAGSISVGATPYTASAGTASDETSVASVAWSNAATGESGTATGTTSWTVPAINLASGANPITYRSTDDVGNVSSPVTRTITYTPAGDTTIPTVAITTPAANVTVFNTPYTEMIGTATDNVGLSSVIWSNSAGGSGVAAGSSDWNIPAITLSAGANVITVQSVDTNGNLSTAATRTITYNPPSSGSTETHTNPRNRLGF